MEKLKSTLKLFPGFLLALAIAGVAKFLESLLPVHLIGASVIALFIGMIINSFWKPNELFATGTSNGARALGLNSGSLEVGRIADLMLVDIDNWNFISTAPTLANFIYSAHSDCIDSLMCNGRWIMKNRMVDGERDIIRDARKVLNTIY